MRFLILTPVFHPESQTKQTVDVRGSPWMRDKPKSDLAKRPLGLRFSHDFDRNIWRRLGFRGATSYDARASSRVRFDSRRSRIRTRARAFQPLHPSTMSLIASQIAVACAGSGTPARRSWNPRQHVFARVSSRRDRRGFRGAPASTRVRVGASAESATGGASHKVPTVTEMYVELREMEAQAEANELSCVEAASNNVVASECTVAFVNVAESIDDVMLAARASGVGAPNDAAVARAAVRKAREDRMAAIAEAEADEIACVTSGGGVECTAAFNEAYDRAYETTMAKTERYHSLLKRWIRSSGGRK